MDQRIIQGDCIAVMRTMPAKSIKAAVFSPPYNLSKKYSLHDDNMPEAEYLAWQGEFAKELARVMRDDGHVFANVGFNSAHPRRAEDVVLQYERYFVR
jgi:DNA modification methylase